MSKTALITGGSSGLGLELARQLRQRGYDLILLARDAEKLAAAKASLETAPGGAIHVWSCDIADEDWLNTVFARIRERIGQIDFLVLNAGVASIDLLSDYRDLPTVMHTLKVNLLGAVAVTYLSAPLLPRGARILFVSSGFGLIGPAGYSLYAAAKAGMNNFADALRREMLGRGISVHLACPGDIDTPMLAGELRDMPDWIRDKMGRGKPMPPATVAARLLDGCFRGRFLIVPSADVSFLILMQKLLPRRLSTWIVDRILPLPPVAATTAAPALPLSSAK